MPVSPTYPGVYIEEIPSGVRTISGVSTSTTAFVGRALKGPPNEPVIIHSFAEFQREFGGLWVDAPMSVSVNQFFANGGGEAVIVRVFEGIATDTATFELTDVALKKLNLAASSPGLWANDLKVTVDSDASAVGLVNLTVTRVSDPTPLETLRNLSTDPKSGAFVTSVLRQRSAFLRVTSVDPQFRAAAEPAQSVGPTNLGGDGTPVPFGKLVPAVNNGTGIYALDKTDIFNILCVPPPPGAFLPADYTAAYGNAATYCAEKRAMLIVDSPPNETLTNMKALPAAISATPARRNAALYYPWIRAVHPLKPGIVEDFPPSGAIAGIYARTDVTRGVWKAPAGIEAGIAGAQGLVEPLGDGDSGQLNPRAVNALRVFAAIGAVVWGARTLDGDDKIASEWKYVPVRRTALYIEESLFRGLKWVVFEPNAEPLWAQIRLNVGAFMNNLFRQEAFAGTSPRDAYFVKCDKDTTTQNDVNLGIVNVLVGFAPLKPAEFVILKLQQMAGQISV